MSMHLDAFQAIADPTRRRIVETLRGGEQQVNDVVERLEIHQSGVSRHLHILLDAGFVQMRPDGQRRLYSLRPEPFREIEGWVAGYRSLWEARLDRFGDAVQKETSRPRSEPEGEEKMTDKATSTRRQPLKFERSYEAPLEDLWDLWTTKEGFESWWGPEGFRVEVHKLEARVGGELLYDMIAAGAAEIAYMKSAGMPVSHETRGTFAEIEPRSRLKLRHLIDFIPGVEPYKNDILVEFFSEGPKVRMLVTIEPHRDDEWTRRSGEGFASQLKKVPAALAARRK